MDQVKIDPLPPAPRGLDSADVARFLEAMPKMAAQLNAVAVRINEASKR